MKKILLKVILVFFVTLIFTVISAQATTLILGFSAITNNNPANPAIGEAQYSVAISDYSPLEVLFLFSNVGLDDNIIAQVYFDDNNSILSNLSIQNGTGVNFTSPTNPGNLPSGSTAIPPFVADWNAGMSPGGAANGVNPGETVGILFDGIFANVQTDIASGNLRIGIHGQSIGTANGSEAFINTTTPPEPIPEPTTISLMGLGLIGLGFLARKKSKPKS